MPPLSRGWGWGRGRGGDCDCALHHLHVLGELQVLDAVEQTEEEDWHLGLLPPRLWGVLPLLLALCSCPRCGLCCCSLVLSLKYSMALFTLPILDELMLCDVAFPLLLAGRPASWLDRKLRAWVYNN